MRIDDLDAQVMRAIEQPRHEKPPTPTDVTFVFDRQDLWRETLRRFADRLEHQVDILARRELAFRVDQEWIPTLVPIEVLDNFPNSRGRRVDLHVRPHR